MARPSKQTVDYFPHQCKHGKTIFILQQKYQARGYAFWFKLLEQLGSSEGHYLDLSQEDTLEFLSAETWFSPPETLEILDLLARLKAIDENLWKNKIVWCDNFVKGIEDVYRKRTVSVPVKPVSDTVNPVSDVGNPQSKVKETKGNKTKGNNLATTSVAEPINQVFKIFYDSINPQINYGNRTWRKATEDLIKSYGLEEVLKLTEVACAVQGQEYAPTITNPYQLKEKLASLQIFIQRANQPKKGVIQSL